MARAGHTALRKPVLLALETAGLCGSVALVAEGLCICEFSLQSKLTHSRRLLQAIELIMQEAALTWQDLDGLAVSLGPGSFTGLRIGLATVKGLSMATAKPIIGVPTLDGLASQFANLSCPVCPVLDARKKEVYAALYKGTTTGTPQKISEYLAISPERLAEKITEPTVLVGDGLTLYGDFFRERLGGKALMAPAEIYFPRAAAIGMLARHAWEKKEFLSPRNAVPIYVRPSEAEIHFGAAREKA